MIYHNLSKLRTENVYATICLYYYQLLCMLQGMSLLKLQSDQELHLYEKTTGFNRLVNQMTATSELIVAEE